MNFKYLIQIITFIGLYSLTVGSVFAQTDKTISFPQGEIVEKVRVKSDQTQSYALYLPRNYTPDKKWAILYAFEPMARGKLPVTIFQAAAEKYGYIVVGSYNSQNALDGGVLSKILSALWNDTHQRFAIDERRVYATGFSGGSRVASGFAASCGCVAGVIGSGAGFPIALKPMPSLPFIYFNAIGLDDYNYYEIRALRKGLEEAKITHRVEKFDGAHQWLIKSVAEEALAWMQLYGMKKGILAKDDEFIDSTFKTRIAKAENYFSRRQYLEAFQSFLAIATDFSDFKDVSEITKKIENLRNSDDLRKAIRDEESQIVMQEKHANFIISTGYKLRNTEEKMTALPELRTYIANLQKDADEKEDSPRRRIARRSLSRVFAETYEAALFRYERDKQYDLAKLNFELANEIYPKSPRIPYDRARIYALSGQKKQALDYLEKAIGFGFKNWQEMEAEKAFEKIRQEEKFQKLLKQINESINTEN